MGHSKDQDQYADVGGKTGEHHFPVGNSLPLFQLKKGITDVE